MATAKNTDPSGIEILPKYDPAGRLPIAASDMCTVLYGYGRVPATTVYYIDDYKFVGGVGRNIPRSVAKLWRTGTRADGKPAISRVYPQAILASDANEADFATATGVIPMPPSELAAMIDATEAQALVAALGRQKAAALIDDLKASLGTLA
jgi:hypothetical protein